MTTYIKFQYNDNVCYELSTSSFLYKDSTFLPLFEVAPASLVQSFDINENNTSEACADVICTIPILCPSSYVFDENDNFLFNDKIDLLCMIMFRPSKFINICKFLDIIQYKNDNKIFSKQFIEYVMSSSYAQKHIYEIQYFMHPEIQSIMNYVNNIDIDIQIRTCTPEFYFLYLSRYKGHVIKYNRYDIYIAASNKNKYYSYVHKFDNQTTYQIKQEQEYIDYIIKINNQLLNECNINYLKTCSKKQYPSRNDLKNNNFNKIKKLINIGANVNFQDNNGHNALIIASCQENNIEIVKYLVDYGAKINLQNNNGYSALHYACTKKNNIEVIKYLVECGIDIHLQNNHGWTALSFACTKKDNIKAIKFLVESGVNRGGYNPSINIQDNEGITTLMRASCIPNNLEAIKCLIKYGADIGGAFDRCNLSINLQDNEGSSVLHYASIELHNIEIVKYLVECGVNVNLQDNDGNTALHNACYIWYNVDIIQYLIEHGANINLQNNKGNTVLYHVNHVIYSDDVDDYLRQFI